MGYIARDDRDQALALPERVENYVTADAAVCGIDAFVDGLDLAQLDFDRSGLD